MDAFLPYLLNHVGGRLAGAFARELKTTPINYTMWRVLGTLWCFEPLHLVEVSFRSNLDISTLSRVASDLEGKGLIKRVRNNKDGRNGRVKLTEQGRLLVEKLLPIALEQEQMVAGVLSEGERLLLIEILNKLDRAVVVLDSSPPETRSEAEADATDKAPLRDAESKTRRN